MVEQESESLVEQSRSRDLAIFGFIFRPRFVKAAQTPVALLRQAISAARINDARVLTTASGRETSIHQWEELRMFDPGD